MSGDSWDYLCYEDAVELLGRMGGLRDMKERLQEEGFNKAADHVVSLVTQLEHLQNSIDEINKGLDTGLSDVFRAVEWYDSDDIGLDSMQERIEQYEDGWYCAGGKGSDFARNSGNN